MSQAMPRLSSSRLHLTTDCQHVAQLASRLFEKAVPPRVLQHGTELQELLGRPPDHPASPRTGLALAVLAWQQLPPHESVGSPASAAGAALLTGRLNEEGAGADASCVLAVQTAFATGLWVSSPGPLLSASRRNQQQTVEGLLAAAAHWLSAGREETAVRQRSGQGIRFFSAQPALPVAELYDHRQPFLWQTPGTLLQTSGPPGPYALLSGSFNPRHAGHVQLAEAAAAWLGRPVHFELPVINADKPPLDYLSLEERSRQFEGSWLALTSAPAFTGKAKLFPGTVFVVGADTAERILQPVYYRSSEDRMRAELAGLGALNCRFLVAARQAGGQLQTLHDLQVPRELRGLFEELPAARFQLDISSTLHRQQMECPFSHPPE